VASRAHEESPPFQFY